MNEENKEDAYLSHMKASERQMKIWAGLFIAFILFCVWFMLSE